MAKQRKNNETRAEPLTLDVLKRLGALDKYLVAPSGAFDPNGAWEQTWLIWLVASGANACGSLRIKRTPEAGNRSVSLDVAQEVCLAGSTHRVTARLLCGLDPLTAPRSWELESVLMDLNGKPLAGTQEAERAKVVGDKIEVTTGNKALQRDAPGIFTSNWCLFDALQRLPASESSLPEFTLLEDLDLRKEGQRVTRNGAADIELGAQKVRLHGFQHVGHGVLPWQYWLDGQNRLLAAISGIRAYLYCPQAARHVSELAARSTKAVNRKKGKEDE